MAMTGKNGMGINPADVMADGGALPLDALQHRTNEHIQQQIRQRWMVQNEIPAELDDLRSKFLISTWAVENLAKIYALLLQGNGPCHCRPLELGERSLWACGPFARTQNTPGQQQRILVIMYVALGPFSGHGTADYGARQA